MKRVFHFVLLLLAASAALGNIPNSRLACTFDATGKNVFEYYHADHLRSTSILTDKNGNRIQHHEYSAFGRDRYTESSTAFPVSRRYTSQVFDEDTGLYFYGARYYDPQLGRFIQPDTIIPDLSDPQSLNRYSYCLNNPLKHIDPGGHQSIAMRPGVRGAITTEMLDSANGNYSPPRRALVGKAAS